MPIRLEYWNTAPDVLRYIMDIKKYLEDSTLDVQLRHIVLLRISQINGCKYCIDIHAKEALRDGETQARLDVLVDWRDSAVFSETEKAALEWAEVLTNVTPKGTSDAQYATVHSHFNERDLVDLTFLISTMNAWNRVSIAFDHEPD
ncbi:carboxymuconolactone decarboxylase family protein [Amylibacter sp. SFDW26]|uniref:carboxymuconolactone decarboxylase family protein n=1 Tax=Amylibacter sp. SFDW26 TaxID=2652722 RepID=UPI0012618AD9|nr:carboxymuconolactone decarboxylase family protein [Amylibacter sp. SFDW26]KAB7613269.1 carboxymuconolactone decarboxylase family protein [Amylibacter sp. SFDW26]